ncbi:hypothetical protein D9M68_386160 [compost metagenome]
MYSALVKTAFRDEVTVDSTPRKPRTSTESLIGPDDWREMRVRPLLFARRQAISRQPPLRIVPRSPPSYVRVGRSNRKMRITELTSAHHITAGKFGFSLSLVAAFATSQNSARPSKQLECLEISLQPSAISIAARMAAAHTVLKKGTGKLRSSRQNRSLTAC